MLDRMKGIPTHNNLPGLNYKQLRFVDEYMLDGNATQAAIRAGYAEKSAHNTGTRLVSDKSVQSEIAKRRSEVQKSTIMSAQEILELYTDIAHGKVLDQFGLEASLKDRLSALNELAKRQIDLQAKLDAQQDQSFTIKIEK